MPYSGIDIANEDQPLTDRAIYAGEGVRNHISKLADYLVSQDIIVRYIPEGAEVDALTDVMSGYSEQIAAYCNDVLGKRHDTGPQRTTPSGLSFSLAV